tara:strand:- start:79 stop:1122 length:1044 start_codon:yes stop_codon:yes gene_type:complete
MGIFDIDFENLIIKRDKVKDRTVYTIDNFYKYPRAVLNYARQNEINAQNHTSSYPGTIVKLDPYSEEYTRHARQFNEFLEMIGFDMDRVISDFESPIGSFSHNVYFSKYIPGLIKENQNEWEKSRQEQTANTHTDSLRHMQQTSRLGAVCYLSKQCSGGTGLYLNKKTGEYCSRGVEMLLDYLEGKCKIKGFESEDILSKIERTLDKEEKTKLFDACKHEFDLKVTPSSRSGTMSKSDDLYELLHLFPMKFNRLALYEGDLNHTSYIEDDEFWKRYDRITTNYFIQVKWGLSPTGESVEDEMERLKSRLMRLKDATNCGDSTSRSFPGVSAYIGCLVGWYDMELNKR